MLGCYANDYPLSHKSLQAAWRKWFAELKFDYFVTLTFPEEVSEEYAKERMRRYARLLSSEVYIKCKKFKGNNHVTIFWVFERHASGKWHIHAMLHEPSGDLRDIKVPFTALLKPIWHKISGGKQVVVRPVVPGTEDELAGYCLKKAKHHLDRVNIT
jgi:hypothetical protein